MTLENREGKVVLVAGATGGFGSVLAGTLVRNGMTVYGTSRGSSRSAGEVPCELLAMEITDEVSVEICIASVLSREGRIDAVVNCVNHMIIGSVEETSVGEVQALYDKAVFGALRLSRAVLPAMRRQGGGTIVQMSSLGGLVAVPYMSAYTSAKFALEALSEALYHELRGEPIDVVIMQPSAMAMDREALGSHMALASGAGPNSRSHAMLERMALDTAASKLRPEQVAEKVHSVLVSERKPLHVRMGRARPMSLLRRLAPQRLVDRMLAGLLPEG